MKEKGGGRLSIGECVEALMLYGVGPAPLGEASRTEIVDWVVQFEECSHSRAQLEAMSDKDLVSAAYWTMVDYVRG